MSQWVGHSSALFDFAVYFGLVFSLIPESWILTIK